MAKQTGHIKITGSFDGLVCYKMYGHYFVRTQSSLTGKKFWKDKAFEGSRRSCGLLAKASPLASAFYKTYPKEKRRKGLFNEMTGKVKLWLKEGRTADEALLMLEQAYPVKQEAIKKRKQRVKKTKAAKKKAMLFIVLINEDMINCKRRHTAKRLYMLRE